MLGLLPPHQLRLVLQLLLDELAERTWGAQEGAAWVHRGCSLRCKGLQPPPHGVAASAARGYSRRSILSAAKSHASHSGWWCMGGSAGQEVGARSQLAMTRCARRKLRKSDASSMSCQG